MNLRTEWLENPLGIETPVPRLSWELVSNSRAQKQTAWQILAAVTSEALQAAQSMSESLTDPGITADSSVYARTGDKPANMYVLWDSGKKAGDATFGIEYAGTLLRTSQQVFWSVKVWDADGKPSQWSEAASWAMGLLDPQDWTARWISYKDVTPLHTKHDSLCLPPAAYYSKIIMQDEGLRDKRVERAVLYISALGLCQAWINGQPVGDSWLEPGWSDYKSKAYYRTHDVTTMIRDGDNALGAIVTDGWYSGYLGFCLFVGYGPYRSGRNLYGKTPALRAQLKIFYSDGSSKNIVTDESWQVSTDGPIREADILMGESYDALREDAHWCSPHEKHMGDKNPGWRWESAIFAETNGSVPAVFYDTLGARDIDLGFVAPLKMQSYMSPPIRMTEELKTRNVHELGDGCWVFDMAQNFAGVVRLHVRGKRGTRLRLRYAEQIYRDGSVMTENLRCARATDFYTLRGAPDGETWTPRFTYHGFQYVELSVLDGEIEVPEAPAITGIVLHNDTPIVGSFKCSDPVLSQFAHNALWTQRANFVEVPTDCPQRDERLGWTGDALAFIRTASFNADIAAFMTKWLDDVKEAQLDCGAYPDYCPFPMNHGKPYSTAWTDAGIVCPWTIWKVYGDVRVIEAHWQSMERFMDWRYINRKPDGTGVNTGNGYGDWLNVDEPTSIEFIDTCYHALCCRLMTEMAQRLQLKTAAQKYHLRLEETVEAFRHAYIDEDGTLTEQSQTAYVLALWLELVPQSLLVRTAAALSENIRSGGTRMTTGFIGSRLLLAVLSEHGYHDMATRLFQRREFPSWGYGVVNGATSVWERWDSYTREHGFSGSDGTQNASMNSFSHYSFGAVMEWAFQHLAGIDTEDEGFGCILIRPRIPSRDSGTDTVPAIHWVSVTYHSVRGEIACKWQNQEDRLTLEITIPVGSAAKVVIPHSDQTLLTEHLLVDGVRYRQSDDITLITESPELVLRIPSGHWELLVPREKSVRIRAASIT